MTGRPILTAAEMRDAEERAIAAGTPVAELMERAGTAAAHAIARFAGRQPALVLCGPGNNGGDGYVIARVLTGLGLDVRCAALAEPRTEVARQARERWSGTVETFEDAVGAPLLIDGLFGTGLTRGLESSVPERLGALAEKAAVRVAVDLPSGVATDDGSLLSPIPYFDLTITFATLKPSHLLQPSARHMGRIVVADIGIDSVSDLNEIARPWLPAPGPDDHKYSRGYVAVIAGEMPGAAALTAAAATRAGAGYVRLIADRIVDNVPRSVVQGGGTAGIWKDRRVGAIVIGPGLGNGPVARRHIAEAIGSGRPLVVDADALQPFPNRAFSIKQQAILTPHAGEFERLFGTGEGGKVERTRAAALATGAIVVFKGADTVVAAPDGRAAIAPSASHWLASAGTGDVLAGVIAAMRARGLPAFEAACAGVWLHGAAAGRAGPGLIADDLLEALPHALARCL